MEAKAGMISYLRFVYGSDKGKVEAGTMFNNSLFHGESDQNYSGTKIDGEVVDTATSDTLQYAPVIPGTIVLSVGGADYFDVPADGSFKDAAGNVLAGVSVDYATGKITGTVVDGVAVYNYNNEDIQTGNKLTGVNVPQINLELAQLPIYAQSRKLAAYWGFDAAYDLKKQLTCKVA